MNCSFELNFLRALIDALDLGPERAYVIPHVLDYVQKHDLESQSHRGVEIHIEMGIIFWCKSNILMINGT